MQPTSEILDTIPDLLAADTGTLGAATAMHVHLVSAPFTPSPALAIGDLTLATFDGSTPKNAGTGAQQVFVDPVSGQRIIQVLEPAGGWHWEVTGTTDLPQNIYGFALTDTADAVLHATALLSAPIALTAVGQAIDLPWLRFQFLPNSPF